MAANQQLQAGVQKFGNINTFGDVIAKNPDFDTWEPQEKKELADMFFSEKYADLSPDEQMELRPQFDAKYLSKPQGGVDLTNGPLNSPQPGLGGVGQALTNWLGQIPGQVAGAVQTELNTQKQNPVYLPFADPRAGLAAIEGVRNLANMPADLWSAGQSAYTGKPTKPIYQIPSLTQAPIIGQALQQYQQEHPVYNFVAENAVPVESLTSLGGKALKGALQGRVVKAAEAVPVEPPKAPMTPQEVQALNKQTAQQLYDLLNSQDVNAKTTGQIKIKEIRKLANRAKDPAKYVNRPEAGARNQRNLNARNLLNELDNIYKASKPAKPGSKTLAPEKLPAMVKAGVKYVEQGGVAKQQFKKVVRKYRAEDQLKINREIEKAVNSKRQAKQAESARAQQRTATKTQLQKAEKAKQAEELKALKEKTRLAKEAAANARAEAKALEAEARKEAALKKQQQAQKKAEIKRQNANSDLLSAIKEATQKPEKTGTATELVGRAKKDDYAQMLSKAQKETAALKSKRANEKASKLEGEAKRLERLSKAPKVLDNADIQAKSDELVAHAEKNEKGSLDAKLSYYRKAAKEDLTKYGLSKERAEATRESYRKLLNAYTQKTSKSSAKPSAVELKAGQEQNRVALSKLNEKGGRYNPGDGTVLQHPSSGMTLEQIKKTSEWDTFDEATKQKAEDAMDAATIDAGVVIEYDAERVGDTGQFKLKTVYPKSLDVIDGRLVMRAANRYGHDATYYLSPSRPNAKTGFSSYTHDLTIMPETAKAGRNKGLEANVYHGQREVPVKDILERPYREVIGKTSETEARLQASAQAQYGQNVGKLNKRLNKPMKQALKDPALNKAVGKGVKKGGFEAEDVRQLKQEVKKTKSKKNLEKGTDC